MFKATIQVTLKESVLDPQGKAIKNSLHDMGFQDIQDIRIGKYFEVLIDTDDHADAEKQVQTICDKLLVNPVVENFSFQLKEES